MAAPGGFFADRTEQTMTIVIPEELVLLLRDGFYFDGHLEGAGSLIERCNRADIGAEVSDKERATAKAHISQFADLIAQAEGSSVCAP
jgi:hypothetical protein